jgi:hypothetical protein
MLQLKLVSKFDTQPVIDSEYYKRKYASSIIFVNDELIDYLCDIWD